ncbi:hypothetical protein N7457_007706 [Penicillium paradoxum]|uniref:uncharacterized protein n=1 Tax=Penicillium paradoxum TaxID=176176 RepID=UPI0025472E9E|nr:uncharacterized protein N7457_007706 [Penicillium paradoxum]KAJ5772810.1 hypothetical protein N7457_007706 [Penicillium paradoxum]
MARLNDYAAPAESIEALKRRFVRQNREIARVNSLQSLRIRSLESEVSHLLSENVSLRKQIINLTQETERLEAGKMLHNGIYDIKSKLDAKLAELNSLATELGSLPRKVGKLCSEQFDRPKQAAESRPRTEDTNGGEDGRLPAIVEDKYYPRRTLEPQEIDSLVNDDHSTLGSPPQFSFMAEETDALIEQSSPSPPETTFSRHIEDDHQPTPSTDPTPHAGSVSMKRKFVLEEDDRFASNLDIDDDEFQFTRPSQAPNKPTNPFEVVHRDQSPIKSHVEATRGSNTPVLPMRKVLEPKSANSNLSSPKKARISSNQNPKVLQRPSKSNENTNSAQRDKDVEKLSDKPASQKPRVSKVAPSTKEKRTSRPTPVRLEEPVLLQQALSPYPNALNTEEESSVRPSRRRGTVVSYAEPNLRDKMRRPTKEMIDAVALGSRRSSSFQSCRASLDGGEDQGHTQPHSSLSIDFTLAGQGSRYTRDNSSEQLLATVSRRKRKVSSTTKDGSDAGSSSSGPQKEIEESLADISAEVFQESFGAKRQTRRHSSNPKSTTAIMAQYDGDQGETQSPVDDFPEHDEILGPGPNAKIDSGQVRRGQRVAARRKSMMV